MRLTGPEKTKEWLFSNLRVEDLVPTVLFTGPGFAEIEFVSIDGYYSTEPFPEPNPKHHQSWVPPLQATAKTTVSYEDETVAADPESLLSMPVVDNGSLTKQLKSARSYARMVETVFGSGSDQMLGAQMRLSELCALQAERLVESAKQRVDAVQTAPTDKVSIEPAHHGDGSSKLQIDLVGRHGVALAKEARSLVHRAFSARQGATLRYLYPLSAVVRGYSVLGRIACVFGHFRAAERYFLTGLHRMVVMSGGLGTYAHN